jgi:hypothetical protein
MVMQPKDHPEGYLDSGAWTWSLQDFNAREGLIWQFHFGAPQLNLTHSVYRPLVPLIRKLASFLVVDRQWLPSSDVRNNPEYINEAFQRLIIKFILDNRDKEFMNCSVDVALRQVKGIAESQTLSSTTKQERDGTDREKNPKRCRLETGSTEVGCVYSIFKLFVLYSQDKDDVDVDDDGDDDDDDDDVDVDVDDDDDDESNR